MLVTKSNLNKLRKKKKITQEVLEKETGINRKFLSRLENGNINRIDMKVLKTLSVFFDKCPIEDLIYWEEENILDE